MCIDSTYIIACGLAHIANDEFAIFHKRVRKHILHNTDNLRLFDDGRHEIKFNAVVSGDILVTVFDENEREVANGWFEADKVLEFYNGQES